MLLYQALHALAWIVAKRARVCLMRHLCVTVLASWTPSAYAVASPLSACPACAQITIFCSGSLSVCDSISQTMQGLRAWLRKIFRYTQALYVGDLRCFPGVMQCGKRSAHC